MEDIKQGLETKDWSVSTWDYDATWVDSQKYLGKIFRRLNFLLTQVSLEVLVDEAKRHRGI